MRKITLQLMFPILVFAIFPLISAAALICPDEWVPVCGSDGKTYSNGCYANDAGITTYVDGPCVDLDNASGLWKRSRRALLNFCRANDTLLGEVNIKGSIKEGIIIRGVSPSTVNGKNDLVLLVMDVNCKRSYLGITELSRKNKIKIKIYDENSKRKKKVIVRKKTNSPVTCDLGPDAF